MSEKFKRVHQGDPVEAFKNRSPRIYKKGSAAAINIFRKNVVLGKRKSMEAHLASKAGKPSETFKEMQDRIENLREVYKSTYPEKELPTILKSF